MPSFYVESAPVPGGSYGSESNSDNCSLVSPGSPNVKNEPTRQADSVFVMGGCVQLHSVRARDLGHSSVTGSRDVPRRLMSEMRIPREGIRIEPLLH